MNQLTVYSNGFGSIYHHTHFGNTVVVVDEEQ